MHNAYDELTTRIFSNYMTCVMTILSRKTHANARRSLSFTVLNKNKSKVHINTDTMDRCVLALEDMDLLLLLLLLFFNPSVLNSRG